MPEITTALSEEERDQITLQNGLEPDPTARDVDEQDIPVDTDLLGGARDANEVGPQAASSDSTYVQEQNVNRRDEYTPSESKASTTPEYAAASDSAVGGRDNFEAENQTTGRDQNEAGFRGYDSAPMSVAGVSSPDANAEGNTEGGNVADDWDNLPSNTVAEQENESGSSGYQRAPMSVAGVSSTDSDAARNNDGGNVADDWDNLPSNEVVEQKKDTKDMGFLEYFSEVHGDSNEQPLSAISYVQPQPGSKDTAAQSSLQSNTYDPAESQADGPMTERDKAEFDNAMAYGTEMAMTEYDQRQPSSTEDAYKGTVSALPSNGRDASEAAASQQPTSDAAEVVWSGAGGNTEYQKTMDNPEERKALNKQFGISEDDPDLIVNGRSKGGPSMRDRAESFEKEMKDQTRYAVPEGSKFGEGAEIVPGAESSGSVAAADKKEGGTRFMSAAAYQKDKAANKAKSMSPSGATPKNGSEGYEAANTSTGAESAEGESGSGSGGSSAGVIEAGAGGNLADKSLQLTGTAALTINGMPSGEMSLNLEGTGDV